MGLPLACVFAKHGAAVTVADIDADLVRKIDEGRCPYEEPGLPALMAQLRRTGKLRSTTDTTAATSTSDVIVTIVPARLTAERDIDYAALEAASSAIGRGLQRGALVVYETTVSVGGTRNKLVPLLERHSGLRAGLDFHVGYSPERVKANVVLERLETTPKVVGGLNESSLARTAWVYREFLRAPVDEVGSIEAAEMTKLVGMLYRDVNIALANELAAFCELAGIDFERVRRSANAMGKLMCCSRNWRRWSLHAGVSVLLHPRVSAARLDATHRRGGTGDQRSTTGVSVGTGRAALEAPRWSHSTRARPRLSPRRRGRYFQSCLRVAS